VLLVVHHLLQLGVRHEAAVVDVVGVADGVEDFVQLLGVLLLDGEDDVDVGGGGGRADLLPLERVDAARIAVTEPARV
jgi:hypothetical protein